MDEADREGEAIVSEKVEVHFTPKNTARILELIKAGMEPARAAQAVGVTGRVLRLWQRHAAAETHRRDEGLRARPSFNGYIDFAADLDRAIGEAEAFLVMRLQQAARGGPGKTTVRTEADGKATTTTETEMPKWQSAAWLLERRWPERWQRRESLTVTDMTAIATDVVAIIGAVLDDPDLGLSPELRARGRDLALKRLMAEAGEEPSYTP